MGVKSDWGEAVDIGGQEMTLHISPTDGGLTPGPEPGRMQQATLNGLAQSAAANPLPVWEDGIHRPSSKAR
jgi:hypothetical protein